MWEDPIVAETRKLREEMVNEAGNDLDALFRYLQEQQAQYRERLVRLPARTPVPPGTIQESSPAKVDQ